MGRKRLRTAPGRQNESSSFASGTLRVRESFGWSSIYDSLENGEIIKRAMNAEITATFVPNARSSYPRHVRLFVTFDNTLPISNSLTGAGASP